MAMTDTNQACKVKRSSLNKSDIDVKLEPISNQASEDELEKQIESITQDMFVALSEWQAGVPIDWHSAKVKGRADLLDLIRTGNLKLLAEVRERVVGEYETEYSNLDGDAGYWEKHGRNGMREKQIANLTKLEAEL